MSTEPSQRERDAAELRRLGRRVPARARHCLVRVRARSLPGPAGHERGRYPVKSLWLACLAVAALGCLDREQEARATGERARLEIAAACTADAGASTLPEECVHARCAAACRAHAAAPVFHAACVAACAADAECATDAECAPGRHSVAIAPRVRRCTLDAAR
jgi:hypothetical protein